MVYRCSFSKLLDVQVSYLVPFPFGETLVLFGIWQPLATMFMDKRYQIQFVVFGDYISNTIFYYVRILCHQTCFAKYQYLVHTPSRGGGASMFLTPPPTLTEDFFLKSPPQANNFWGPFFQKFDGFWKKFRKISGFLCLHNEKKAAAGEKFGNSFFCAPEARQKFSEDFFIFVRGPP